VESEWDDERRDDVRGGGLVAPHAFLDEFAAPIRPNHSLNPSSRAAR
jgi:hypothetical protein